MVFNFERYFYSRTYLTVAIVTVAFKELFAVYSLNITTYLFTLGLLLTTLSMFSAQSLKNLNQLLRAPATPHFRFALLIALLSLSGVPPLLGFFAKFFIFVFLTSKGSHLLLGLFFFFNLFALYFYLQNTRYLIHSQSRKEYRIFLNRTRLDDSSAALWVCLVAILCFGFILLEGMLILLCNIGA